MGDTAIIKLCGLWVGTDKNNEKMLSGTLGYGTKILVLKNAYKKSEKHPDFILYLAEAQKEKPQDEPGEL